MSDIDQIDRDLEEMWTAFEMLPEEIIVGTTFGAVAMRSSGAVLLGIDKEGHILGERPLTTDEVAQFKTEYPRLFE